MANHRREPTKVLRVPESLLPTFQDMIRAHREITHADPKWYEKQLQKRAREKENFTRVTVRS